MRFFAQHIQPENSAGTHILIAPIQEGLSSQIKAVGASHQDAVDRLIEMIHIILEIPKEQVTVSILLTE